MELQGTKLKYYRKQKGISQADLANKICTQAMISLMENKNKLPGMEILFPICERLEIKIDDLIGRNSHQLNDTFETINQLLLTYQYDLAENALNEIKIKQLRSNLDKQRYYYFIGIIQLHVNQELDEAMFNFKLANQNISDNQINTYQVLAMIEMGLIYFTQDNQKLANQMVDESMVMIQKLQLNEPSRQLIQLNVNLAKLAYKTNQILISIKTAETAIAICKQNDLLLLLDESYLYLAKCNQALGELNQAKKQIIISQAVNEIINNVYLAKLIQAMREKLEK